MKITRQLSSLLALTLGPILFASAQTSSLPLVQPEGLALDASGTLYVANSGADNVLSYTPAYVQRTGRTIKEKNASLPSAVAIDPYGNLWVANSYANSITEYTEGVQKTSATISVSNPGSLAIDGLDNLWVVSGSDVEVYSPTAAYAPPSQLVRAITPAGSDLSAVGVAAGALAIGNGTQVLLDSASATLQGNPLNGGALGFGAGTIASDSSGNFYVAAFDGKVHVAHPDGTINVLVTLPFPKPSYGIAVDSIRKRVYVSDWEYNRIFVYSTAGALLYTIHN